MAVNSCEEGQDAVSISVLPDEGINNMPGQSQLAFLSLLEVPKPSKSEMCLVGVPNVKKMVNGDAYSPCIADLDIEKGISAISTEGESTEKLKTEGSLTRQISLQIGEKFMQILSNHKLALPKFASKDKSATEWFNDTPTNRSRKCKRSASFNSRRVVLLFSGLSSMGTMILIYLTLRVRQVGDGLVHV